MRPLSEVQILAFHLDEFSGGRSDAALHSRQTAMTNLGLLDPRAEMAQMALEGVR